MVVAFCSQVVWERVEKDRVDRKGGEGGVREMETEELNRKESDDGLCLKDFELVRDRVQVRCCMMI